jgi:hypothetical protein
MTTYYRLITLLKTIFEQDNDVNTVLTGDFEEWKKDIFSIVHIEVLSSAFVGLQNVNVTRYEVSINVLDIRDVNKENVKDKFWNQDNRHDIWNTTRAVLKRAENKMIKDTEQTDITLTDATAAEKVTYAYMNGLDGWQQTWTIDVPDELTTVCYD